MDRSVIVVACGIGLFTGCGDVSTFKLNPGDMGSGPPPTLVENINGSEVRVLRHSTYCKAKTSEPLVAAVHDGVEFSTDEATALAGKCAGSPDPIIDVDLDALRLIFDFSNTGVAARFPVADFEGYIFEFVEDEEAPLLGYAWVDEQTNVDIDMSFGAHHLDLNFADAAYDSTGFVQINLIFIEPAVAIAEAE